MLISQDHCDDNTYLESRLFPPKNRCHDDDSETNDDDYLKLHDNIMYNHHHHHRDQSASPFQQEHHRSNGKEDGDASFDTRRLERLSISTLFGHHPSCRRNK